MIVHTCIGGERCWTVGLPGQRVRGSPRPRALRETLGAAPLWPAVTVDRSNDFLLVDDSRLGRILVCIPLVTRVANPGSGGGVGPVGGSLRTASIQGIGGMRRGAGVRRQQDRSGAMVAQRRRRRRSVSVVAPENAVPAAIDRSVENPAPPTASCIARFDYVCEAASSVLR